MDQHIDKVTGAAKSALNKIGVLTKGRKGISSEKGIELYKSLIRPHLEHALASWAGLLSENHFKQLEKVQAQSLRTIMGVFASSSTNALEVIANVTPFRLRIKELCIREFARITSLKDGHPLKIALDAGTDYYIGKDGSPIGFLRFVSRELSTALISNKLKVRKYHCPDSQAILNRREVKEKKIFASPLGNSKSRTEKQKKTAQEGVVKFLGEIGDGSLVVFTDGSVQGENSFGEGGCGVVMYKSGDEGNVRTGAFKVGKVTENVQCEVEGVVRALQSVVEVSEADREISQCYILTDCKSAVDIVCKQNNIGKYWEEFQRMWQYMNRLDSMEVRIEVVWVPGHADIKWNDMADYEAKKGAAMVGDHEEWEEVTSNAIVHWISSKIKKEWNRMWCRSESGFWTKELELKAGDRRMLPGKRDLDMSYIRALIDNTSLADNMFRFGLMDNCNCTCGKDRETLEHVLLDCELEKEARHEYIEGVKELWMSKKCDGNLNINLQLVLAPFAISRLNTRDADEMLKLSFEFIRNLSKKF